MKSSIPAEPPTPAQQYGTVTLVTGGVAAFLASACCLGPLVLILLGFGGAWIGNLALLEPYRPFFIAIALLALGLAGWRLYRPAKACTAGEVCAVPRVRILYKVAFWVVVTLVLISLVFPYVLPLFY
ncbi:mercuric ion transporter MerT [Polaromonas sp. P5_D5]